MREPFFGSRDFFAKFAIWLLTKAFCDDIISHNTKKRSDAEQ